MRDSFHHVQSWCDLEAWRSPAGVFLVYLQACEGAVLGSCALGLGDASLGRRAASESPGLFRHRRWRLFCSPPAPAPALSAPSAVR